MQKTFAAVSMWILFLCWMASVFWLSSLTPADLPKVPLFTGADKMAHTILFAVGAILLTMALRQTVRLFPAVIAVAVIVSLSVFGIIDEWRQLYTVGRSGGDLMDWLADSIGAALGAFATRAYYERRAGARAAREAAIRG